MNVKVKIEKKDVFDLIYKVRETPVGGVFEYNGERLSPKRSYTSKPCEVCVFRNNADDLSKQCYLISACTPHMGKDHKSVVIRKSTKN